TELTIGAWPHVVAGLGRDDEFVAQPGEVGAQHVPEIPLGGAARRSIIVGQVELSDALVERVQNDVALRLHRAVITEVVPSAEGDEREFQAAGAGAAHGHAGIAMGWRWVASGGL